MLEMNFSQIWEVTRTPIGWFDMEWPIYVIRRTREKMHLPLA